MGFVNHGYGSNDGAGTTLSVTYSPTNGNLIAALGFAYPATTQNTVTDDATGGSNTYTSVDTLSDGSFTRSSYGKNLAGSPTHIILNTENTTFRRLHFGEYSGLDTTAPLDDHHAAFDVNDASPNNVSSGDGAGTTVDGCTIVGLIIQTSVQENCTVGTGFTGRDPQNEGAGDGSDLMDRVQATAGTPDAMTCSYTIGGQACYAFMMAFKPASGAAPDQIAVEDASTQLEESDEPYGFSEQPLFDADQISVEDASLQQEELEQPFGFDDAQLVNAPAPTDPIAPSYEDGLEAVQSREDAGDLSAYDWYKDDPLAANFVAADVLIVEDASCQLVDVDEDFGFSDAPQDSPAVVDQIFVDDASAQLEELEEPYGFSEQPIHDSDQITAECADTQLEDVDEPYGFSDSPLFDVDQIFVEDGSNRWDELDEPYGFDLAPLSADAAATPNQHRMVYDIDTGRLGWMLSGAHTGSPILVKFF